MTAIKKVGIALAAYQPENNPDFLLVFAEQLRSIQEQTFRDWICVITLDSRLAPLREEPRLAPFFSDSRFVWIENPVRLGHKKNFEKAMQAAAALGVDAVGCSDQDDVWYPRKIETCVRELENSGPLSLVHSDMHVLRAGRIEEQTAWEVENRGVNCVRSAHFLVRNVVAGCAMLLDAELVRRYPVIPDGAEYHDHWYALVASYHGGVRSIREPLFAYRQHGGNTVGVTPFPGVFQLPERATPLFLVRKFLRTWLKSHRLAVSALEQGLPLSAAERRQFVSKWDLGWSFLRMALAHRRIDPALTRASSARCVGKFLACFGLEPLVIGDLCPGTKPVRGGGT